MLVNDNNNYGICRIFINLMKTLTLDFAMILFLHPYNIFSLNDTKRVRSKINHSFAHKILKTDKSAPDRCFICLRLVNLKVTYIMCKSFWVYQSPGLNYTYHSDNSTSRFRQKLPQIVYQKPWQKIQELTIVVNTRVTDTYVYELTAERTYMHYIPL